VPLTYSKKGAFGCKDAEQDLRRLTGARELHGRAFEPASSLGLSAVCALVRYLELLSSADTMGLWTLDWVAANQFMRLDAGAMRALSVDAQRGDSDKNASLMGLFSCCKTQMGARLMRKWLKQPLLHAADLEARYDVVEAFVRGYESRSLLRDTALPKLGGDLEKLGRAFIAKKATLKEVVALYFFVLGLPKLLETLKQHAELATSEDEARVIEARFTEPLEAIYVNFTNLVRLVHAAVDLPAAHRHEYRLQPHFHERLGELADERAQIEDRIDAHYAKLLEKTRMDDDKMHLERDARFGHCLRVTRKEEAQLRQCAAVKNGSLKLDMLQTRKDGVIFRDSTLASLSEEYSTVNRAFDHEQKALVGKVVDTAATFTCVLTECHALLAELDVLLAFAHVSSSAPEPFVRPTLVPPEDARQRIVLRGCRHPCVERMDGVSFIKNDVQLVRTEASLEVVTGPNMGGKSTYLRSAGVCVLLAQVGCFVPCDEAELSLTDAILARVGAGDCQSRGVSTFMAEMLETATILKSATSASLVLIDELGRGTSTYDGYGLAWAIAHHLVTRVGCCTLFATHFHELTRLADAHSAVRNRHVTAHIEAGSMTMLFRVEDGPSDSAYGVHVAKVCRFPAAVVASAKRKLEELEDSDVVLGNKKSGGASGGPETAGRAERVRSAIGELQPAERAAGMSEVRGLLSAFRELPVETMDGAQTDAAVAPLTASLRASTNPLVVALCAQAARE